MNTENQISFGKVAKAGLIAGLFGAGVNNVWSFIAAFLGATIPPGFAIAVTLSSLIPVLIGAVLFFVMTRFVPKGQLVWLVVSIVFILVSFYPVFTTPQLPDGTVLDSTFPLLVGPMHAFSGILAVWGIPKWSK
jgi:hypothetical protein